MIVMSPLIGRPDAANLLLPPSRAMLDYAYLSRVQ